MAKYSQHPILRIFAGVFATIFIGFGVNAFVNPSSALSFFEFEYPNYGASKRVVDALLMVYGIRDVFMGIAIYAAVWKGDNKVTGWILVAASLVAATDGYVCHLNGKGAMNHWSYMPFVCWTGTALVGVLDS